MDYDLIALSVVVLFGFVCLIAALAVTLNAGALQDLAAIDASNELPSGSILFETAVEYLEKSCSPDIQRFLSSKMVRWYVKLFDGGGIWLDHISEQEIRNHLVCLLIRQLERSHRIIHVTISVGRSELIETWHLVEKLSQISKRRYQSFLLESIEDRTIEMKFVQKL